MTFWPGGEMASARPISLKETLVGLQLRRVEKMRPDHRDQSTETA